MPLTTDTLKTLIKNEMEIAKKIPAITQVEINNLYQEIYDYMVSRVEEAKNHGKSPLFIVGETHKAGMGRSSMLVKGIVLKVGERLGINTHFIEADQNTLNLRKQMAAKGKELRESKSNEYTQFSNDMDILVHLYDASFYDNFNLIPAEDSKAPTPEQREVNACNKMIKYKDKPAVVSYGFKHLGGFVGNKKLQEAFEVYPIMAEPKDIVSRQRAVETQSADDNAKVKLALDQTVIKQFGISGNLYHDNPYNLLKKVEAAHNESIKLAETIKPSPTPTNIPEVELQIDSASPETDDIPTFGENINPENYLNNVEKIPLSEEQLLEKFLDKTYYGEGTIVLDRFGTIKKLEDHPRIYLLPRDQYLLFTRRDITGNTIQNKIKDFAKKFRDNATKNINAIVDMFRRIYEELNPAFKSSSGAKKSTTAKSREVMANLLSELLDFDKNHITIKRLLDIYEKNGYKSQDFLQALAKEVSQPTTAAMQDISMSLEDRASLVKSELKKIKVLDSKQEFVNKEVNKLAITAQVRPVFESAVTHTDLVFFIISDFTKFSALLHSNDYFGQMDATRNLIWISFNNLYNHYPAAGVLGGIDLDSDLSQSNMDLTKACYKPLISIMIEEIGDFVFATNQIKLYTELAKAFKASTAILTTMREVINLKLADNNAKLINTKHKILWERMKRVANSMREKVDVETKKLITTVPEHVTLGQGSHFGSGHAEEYFTVKDFLENNIISNQKFVGVRKGTKVALIEADKVKEKLSDAQIASLFSDIIDQIENEEYASTVGYNPEMFNQEIPGKLLNLYVLFPGFIEEFLDDLNQKYTTLTSSLVTTSTTAECKDAIHSQNSVLPDEIIGYISAKKTYQPAFFTTEDSPLNQSHNQTTQSSHTLINHSTSDYKTDSSTIFHGRFSENVSFDPQTKANIFTFEAFDENYQSVGTVQFYGAPILCRMDKSHNLINPTGIFKEFITQLNPNDIEDICAVQPLTFTQQFVYGALNSVTLGAVHGVSNATEELMLKKGYSKPFASLFANSGLYTTFFLIQLYHAMQYSDDLSAAIQEAGQATIQFAATKNCLNLIAETSGWFMQHGHTNFGKLAQFIGNYGILAYDGLNELYTKVSIFGLKEGVFAFASSPEMYIKATHTAISVAASYVGKRVFSYLWSSPDSVEDCAEQPVQGSGIGLGQ